MAKAVITVHSAI